MVSESDLLRAGANPGAGTIVVWTGERERREREYSVAEDRFLSRAEREQELPADREVALTEPRVRVVQRACLLPDSDVLYETYTVYDPRRETLIVECGQEFFTPVYQDPEILVVNAVRRATFPRRYRDQWSPSERVSHWALWLHRARREAGESGDDEDVAFIPAVWRYMLEIDPDIEQLLPEIIDELARLWMTDPDQMLTEFRRRIGI
jgi:hypothetical protein